MAVGALLAAMWVVPPVTWSVLFLDDLGAAFAGSSLTDEELGEELSELYGTRIDITSESGADVGGGRTTVVYVGLERREDCAVVDRYSGAPKLECTADPQPEEAK